MSGYHPSERRSVPAPRDAAMYSMPSPEREQRLFEATPVRDVLAVLWRRLWLVTGVALLVVMLVGAYLYTQPQNYRANAVIRLENTRRAIAGDFEESSRDRQVGRNTDALLSQIQVLKGRTVVGEAVDRVGLRLASSTEAFPVRHLSEIRIADGVAPDTVSLRFQAASVVIRASARETQARYGVPVELGGVQFTLPPAHPGVDSALLVVRPRDETIDFVMAGLQATPRLGTDVIDVTFTSTDSLVSQRVVNAVTEVFLEYDARIAQQQSARRRSFLEGQLARTDSMLALAQLELSDFRSRSRVYHSRDRSSSHQQMLLNLDVRREEIAANRRMYHSLLNTAVQAGAESRQSALRTLVSSPEIATNPVIGQLYAQLVRYEAERDQLQAGPLGSTAESPDVRRLNSLIRDTEAKLTDAARSHVASLDARLTALDELRARSGSEAQQLPALEAEEERLIHRSESIGRVAEQLRSELMHARMAEAIEAGQVDVIHLAPGSVPHDNKNKMKLLLAAMLGLLLGGSSAFALEAVNTSIRRPQDISPVLRVPRLAIIPRMDKPGRNRLLRSARANGASPNHLAVSMQLNSEVADAYRSLRTNLMFSSRAAAFKTLVVTSTASREGKTTMVSNLAISYARQGFRVLLIDADLRLPRLHEVFDLLQTSGLSSLLDGRCEPADAIRETSIPGLNLIPSGELPVDPTELLVGQRMESLLTECRERYDLVIIDTPPVLAVAETAVLAAAADAVLFVVRAGQTDRRAAEEAMQQLAFAGANVVGAALNDPDDLVRSYATYYGGAGYAAADVQSQRRS
jgi:polysaccharide biosynthesis transport protein